MLRPGDPFDHFTIEAELGHGGMGSVYRAHDARLHRRVALKVLRAAPDATAAEWADAKARILREARAAAALEHPNAVSIFELGEVNGEPFIAMELVSGTTLRSHVGNSEVPWQRKLRWLLDAASALGAAHTAGLVHRDVKPENLMVGDNGRVKVLDFGIARRAMTHVDVEARTHAQGAIPTLTGKGQLVGTPQYMPPEQLLGQAIDGRADQFAWAATAFELLTGKLPWASQGDTVALIASILTQPAALARSVAPDLPAEVEAVLARALSKSASERFASIDEVVDLLEPFASAAPSASSIPRRPVASRPGASEASSRTPRRPPRPRRARGGAGSGASRARAPSRAWPSRPSRAPAPTRRRSSPPFRPRRAPNRTRTTPPRSPHTRPVSRRCTTRPTAPPIATSTAPSPSIPGSARRTCASRSSHFYARPFSRESTTRPRSTCALGSPSAKRRCSTHSRPRSKASRPTTPRPRGASTRPPRRRRTTQTSPSSPRPSTS